MRVISPLQKCHQNACSIRDARRPRRLAEAPEIGPADDGLMSTRALSAPWKVPNAFFEPVLRPSRVMGESLLRTAHSNKDAIERRIQLEISEVRRKMLNSRNPSRRNNTKRGQRNMRSHWQVTEHRTESRDYTQFETQKGTLAN